MRTFLFCTCLLGIFSLNSNAQYSWTQKSDFSGAKRYAGVAFGNAAHGYFGMGADFSLSSTSIYKDFWQYNPVNDTWTPLSSLPGLQRYAATGFNIGQDGYVGLGWSTLGGGAQNDFYKFDASTKSWIAIPNFTGSSRYTAIGVSSLNKGYVGFGYASWTNDLYQYNPSSQTWTSMPLCPGSARQSLVGFAYDQDVYIGGGSNNQSNTLADFWRFNTQSQTWTQVADYPHAVYAASSFVINGKGFVGTGRSAGTFYQDFYFYDYGLNSWTGIAPLPGIAREHASGFAVNNKGYIICGRTQSGAYLKDVWELSMTTGLTDISKIEAQLKMYGTGSNELNIDFSPDLAHRYRLRVFDINGRMLHEIFLQGSTHETLSVKNGQAILYLLDRPGNPEVLSGKVLVI